MKGAARALRHLCLPLIVDRCACQKRRSSLNPCRSRASVVVEKKLLSSLLIPTTANLLGCVFSVTLDVQEPALCPFPVTPHSGCSLGDKGAHRPMIRIIKRLHEMIPLEHTDFLRSHATAAPIITLAFAACELGLDVETSRPRSGPQLTLGGCVMRRAMSLAVAWTTHGNEANSAVPPCAPLHLCREL